MKVADPRQVGLAGGQPIASGGHLALRVVPVAAAVVGYPAVAGVLAALDVATQRRSASGIDGGHNLELTEAEMAGMGRSKGGTVLAEDVGDLNGVRMAICRRRDCLRLQAPHPARGAP
jgi:hypothetical protein